MGETWKWSAVEAAAAVRSRAVAPSELVADVLDRIASENPALNAITWMDESSVEEAAQAADDAVIAGAELGPLHGVPVTIKENIDVAGQPSTHGLPVMANNVATEDAPIVKNLKDAGAIVIGRTNTPEFSMRATTDNPLRGRTNNPWGPNVSPGGSSGGAGSACAAGMGALHHGNDIGGSLRFPSFANGVATVKPTSFRMPVFNSTAPAERGFLLQAMSVQGIIARHVADVRLASAVMIRPDPRDPQHAPVPWDGAQLSNPIRVAVTTESHGYPIHPGIVGLIERAAGFLADAGYDVVAADPPPVNEAARQWFRTGATELAHSMRDVPDGVGSETVMAILERYYERGTQLDRDDHIRELGDRTRHMRQWNLFLDEHPLLLAPFLMRPMFDHDADARDEGLDDLFESAMYSTGINWLGIPAGVIGMDLVEERPAGVHLIGRRFREDLICDALEAIEERNGVLSHRLWERS